MNRSKLIEDFGDVKSTARQIDDGINYLEEKLSNISRFGLTLKPEETRAKAENLLVNMKEETDNMKCNVESYLEEQKQMLVDTIADNNSIKEYIERTKREVKEMEDLLRCRKDYQPYEPEESEEDMAIADNPSPEMERICQTSLQELSDNGSNSTKHDYQNKKISSNLKKLSNFSSSSPRITNYKLAEKKPLANTNLNIEKSFNDLNLSSCMVLKPRKLNTTDDNIRTPGNFPLKTFSMKTNMNDKVKNKITSIY